MTDRFFVELLVGERAGERIPIGEGRFTIGRKVGCSLLLPDPKTSGTHAEIAREGDHLVLRDLGSTNGTLLDGKRVDEVILSHGDRITVGATDLRFVDASVSAEEGPRVLAGAKPARRSLAVPLAALVVLAAGGYVYFTFGRGAEETATPVVSVPGNGIATGASFEPTESENLREIWRLSEGAPTPFAIESGERRSGHGAVAVRFDGPSFARLAYAAETPVEDVRSYALRAFVRGEGGAAAGLRVEFTSSRRPGFRAVRGGDLVEVSPEWRAIEANVQPPAGSDRARFFVVASGERGRVVVDDASFVAAGSGGARPLSLHAFEFFPDPLGGALRRIETTILSDLALALRVGEEVWPAASVVSPGERTLRGPGGTAGRFTHSVEPTPVGFRTTWRVEREGPPSVRSLLSFVVDPDLHDAAGALLFTEEGTLETRGDFRAERLSSLVLGEGPERVRLAFDPPAAVEGRRTGEGTRIEVAFEGSLALGIQVSFEEERRLADDLVHRARAAEGRGAIAEAISLYERVRAEFPFERETLAAATERRDALLREGLARLPALEERAEEARFFRLPSAFEEVATEASKVEERYAATEVATRASLLREKMLQESSALESERKNAERERLSRVADELERLGAKTLAALARGK